MLLKEPKEGSTGCLLTAAVSTLPEEVTTPPPPVPAPVYLLLPAVSSVMGVDAALPVTGCKARNGPVLEVTEEGRRIIGVAALSPTDPR